MGFTGYRRLKSCSMSLLAEAGKRGAASFCQPTTSGRSCSRRYHPGCLVSDQTTERKLDSRFREGRGYPSVISLPWHFPHVGMKLVDHLVGNIRSTRSEPQNAMRNRRMRIKVLEPGRVFYSRYLILPAEVNHRDEGQNSLRTRPGPAVRASEAETRLVRADLAGPQGKMKGGTP